MNKHNKLKVCASCKWIFKENSSCPKCEFASYGAHFVYGKKCYQYQYTQEPWMENKISIYTIKLFEEIELSNPIKKEKPCGILFKWSKK